MSNGDKKGTKVEGFRLTDEQRDFQKKVGQLQDIKKLLGLATLQEKARFGSLMELWQGLEEEFLRLSPPSESTKELEGMDFNIRY